MSIDWTQMLQGLQQAAQPQAQQASLFPTGPWGNLASIIRTIGVGMAVPKAKAQSDMTAMLNQAKAFGLPGIRKVYSDPKFQQDAKIAGVTLPQLPDLSPAELTAQREQDFIKEAQQRADAEASAQTQSPTYNIPPSPTGGPFGTTPGQRPMAPTPTAGGGDQGQLYNPTVTSNQLPSASWRKIYADLALKYPDAAQSLGIVTPVAPGVMSTLIRSMTDYRSDPATVMRAIDTAFTSSGYDPNNLPPEVQAEATAQVGQYASLYFQNMEAQIQQRVQAGGLSQTRANNIINTFQQQQQLTEARIREANATGNYRDAMTALEDMNTQMTPLLDEARIANLGQTGDAAMIRANAFQEEVNQYGPLRNAMAQYYVDRGNYLKTTQGSGTGSLPSLKAQEAALSTLIRSTLSMYNQTMNTPLGPKFTQDVRSQQLDKERQELNGYIGQLNILKKQIAAGGGPAGGGTRPPLPPSLNPFNELNQQFQGAFMKMSRDNNLWTGDAQTVFSKVAQAYQLMQSSKTAPKDPAQWDAFWRTLVYHAYEQYGLTLPDTPSTTPAQR